MSSVGFLWVVICSIPFLVLAFLLVFRTDRPEYDEDVEWYDEDHRTILQPPFFVARHRDTTEKGMLGWFCMVDPPYYRGRSLRIRYKTTSYEVGICWKSKKPPISGLPYEAEELTDWRRPSDEEVEPAEEATAGSGPATP